MADLILYTNPQSRGRIVRWMLEEVGEPYETEIIPYDQMKSERYLAVHPLGKVPALKHKDHILTECAAICAYLADVFPPAGLGPRVLLGRRRVLGVRRTRRARDRGGTRRDGRARQ